MAQPAIKQNAQLHEVSIRDTDPASPDSKQAQDNNAIKASLPGLIAGVDNPVKKAVDEFRGIIDEMDDIRENLRAHGIPLRTTRMIVEFGIQKKPEKQAPAIDSALEQASATYGENGITRASLENEIGKIVELERDLTHARTVAREEGLDAQALSILTQMVQQNPGDGGTKAVNTFLGYAVAMGIKTDQLKDMVGELTRREESVLPQIPRNPHADSGSTPKQLAKDMLIGLIIGLTVIWLLL